MAKRDHEGLVFDEVRGLYSRNDRIVPPHGYLSQADNIVYTPAFSDTPTNSGSLRFRESFLDLQTLHRAPIRFWLYEKLVGSRYILLDNIGQFWESGSGGIILTIPDAIDFHGITINDHFYFTPHNRETGLDGQFVYVYNPSLASVARKAAGAPLTGTFTVAVSTVAGTIEPGLHVVAVSYVTDTGFRSKPALHQTFTAPNPRKKLNLTAIPLGPTGTVARLIWLSHVRLNYDGNAAATPLFLVYQIQNNTTTVLNDTIDAFDSQLITSADPYVDLLPELPAGTFLTNFDGRLVICGSKASPHTLYISNVNEPENIDSIDGVREIAKGDGGGIKTTRSMRGNLPFWKSERTGILRPNGDVPAEWPYEIIDSALGAEVYSVSEVVNAAPGVFFEVFLVANRLGLNVFNGTYQNVLKPLSHNITPDWHLSESLSERRRTKVLVDPINFRIYVILFRDEIAHWFYADFANGLNFEGLKWSKWNFDYPNLISENYIDAHIVNNSSISEHNTVVLAIVSGVTKLRRLLTNSIGSGADASGNVVSEFAMQFADEELGSMNISSVRTHLGASLGNNIGEYLFEGEVLDNIVPTTENSVIERFVNKTNEIVSFKFRALGGDYNITRLVVFLKKVFAETARLR